MQNTKLQEQDLEIHIISHKNTTITCLCPDISLLYMFVIGGTPKSYALRPYDKYLFFVVCFILFCFVFLGSTAHPRCDVQASMQVFMVELWLMRPVAVGSFWDKLQ